MKEDVKAVDAIPDSLLPHVRTSLRRSDFVRLVLSKYRGKEPELRRVDVRLIKLSNRPHLSFVFHYQTKDVTKNHPIEYGLERLDSLLGTEFRSGHLFTREEEFEAQHSRKGKVRISRRKAAAPRKAAGKEHNRKKERLLNSSAPFLRELGVTGKDGKVRPSKSDKWKQINRFLEIVAPALRSAPRKPGAPLRVVDFGAGKGYLTFAIHHYLRTGGDEGPQVTGVELRPNLVAFCNEVARRLDCKGLTFVEGDVHSSSGLDADVLVALHACDTATDVALHAGVSAGANVLLTSPCCHKQIRPQIRIPDVLSPVLRHGIHLEREAEMITDSLRGLLLEEAGYKVQVMEFVSSEHTDKNKLLVATKQTGRVDATVPRARIDALKTFYGINQHHLETLLRSE